MKSLSLLFLFVLIGSTAVQAKKPPPTLDFLSPDTLDVKAILPPPPPPDTSEERVDVALYQSTRAGATEVDLRQAKLDGDTDSVWEFYEVLGPSFTATALPKTALLFGEMSGDIKEAVKVAKKTFKRPGPPERSDTSGLADDSDQKDKFSYPSGHTTRAYVWASLLAELFPDKRDALMAKAGRMGWERVILGKHYPADVDAGKIYGVYLAKQFRGSPKFHVEWIQVQQEMIAAQLVAP